MMRKGDISVKFGCLNEHLDAISKMLMIPVCSFDVMDRQDNIYILSNRSNYPEARQLTGIIVDLETQKVLLEPVNRALCLTSNKLELKDVENGESGENNLLQVKTTDGQLHNFENYQLYHGFQGLHVRVFKVRSKVYWATSKTLDFRDKSWGIYKTFGEMWQELQGPTEEQLFGDQANGAYYYQFLMVHKNLQVASRFLDMKPGFIILMDKQLMPDMVAPDHPGFEVTEQLQLSAYINQPGVYANRQLSLEEANRFLLYGLHPDIAVNQDLRLANGEFIFIKCPDSNLTIEVDSIAYDYRRNARNGKGLIHDRFLEHFSNFMIRFDELSQEANFKKEFIAFQKFKAPCIEVELLEDIKWPLNIDVGLKLVFRWFLYTLPPVLQVDHHQELNSFFEIRKRVANWIKRLTKCSISYIEECFGRDRIYTIINQAINYGRNGNYQGIELTGAIERNIDFLVKREWPFSIIKIKNIMEKFGEFFDPHDRNSYKPISKAKTVKRPVRVMETIKIIENKAPEFQEDPDTWLSLQEAVKGKQEIPRSSKKQEIPYRQYPKRSPGRPYKQGNKQGNKEHRIAGYPLVVINP